MQPPPGVPDFAEFRRVHRDLVVDLHRDPAQPRENPFATSGFAADHGRLWRVDHHQVHGRFRGQRRLYLVDRGLDQVADPPVAVDARASPGSFDRGHLPDQFRGEQLGPAGLADQGFDVGPQPHRRQCGELARGVAEYGGRPDAEDAASQLRVHLAEQ